MTDQPAERDGHVPGRTVTQLTDVKALRAYAHPVRGKLIVALRTRGPLTATQAGRLLGESSGTASFHLRQLAKYGLVEEAGGGTGREKPWRATATSTSWDEIQPTPEATEAARALTASVAQSYSEELQRWLAAVPDESEEWQRAAFIGDRFLWVTADELAEIGRELLAVTDKYFERQTRPELRPPGSRLATYLHLGFPNKTLPDDTLPDDTPAGDA
jgi:DNA-binding transcriptional ArsR family regulator